MASSRASTVSDLDNLLNELETASSRASVADSRASYNPGPSQRESLHALFDTLEKEQLISDSPGHRGVQVMPTGGGGDPLHRVQQNAFSDSVTRNHPSVLGLNDRPDKPSAPAVNYDRRRDMQQDEADISNLVHDLDALSRESSQQPRSGAPRNNAPMPPSSYKPAPSSSYTPSSYKPAAAAPTYNTYTATPAPRPPQPVVVEEDPAYTSGVAPKTAPFLSALENDIVREINRCRMDPPTVAMQMQTQRIPHFNGADLTLPNGKTLRTREGALSVQDAIAALNNQRNGRPVLPSEGISSAARDSLRAAAATGSSNSDTLTRLNQFGDPDGHVMEMLGFGEATAQEMVWRMIIGDGDPKRAQRRVLLDPKWKKIGVAVVDHKSPFKKMLSVTLCEDYKDKPSTQGY